MIRSIFANNILNEAYYCLRARQNTHACVCFKLHAVVNRLGSPLNAVLMSGNRYYPPFLPKLIDDLEASYVLANAGYDPKTNDRAVKVIVAKSVIASNPRWGKRRKVEH